MIAANVKKLFGKRIRELRTDRGWSQEEFACQVGLDRSYIGSVERGERNISLENICLIRAPSIFLHHSCSSSGMILHVRIRGVATRVWIRPPA